MSHLPLDSARGKRSRLPGRVTGMTRLILANTHRTLRFVLELVERDGADFTSSCGIEAFDRRDQQFWPFVRLPVLKANAAALARLSTDLKRLCSHQQPRIEAVLGAAAEIQLVLTADSGHYLAEVGIDLGLALAEVSGIPSPPRSDLSLFRFTVPTADVVTFAGALQQAATSSGP